jgi:hypothetical protein
MKLTNKEHDNIIQKAIIAKFQPIRDGLRKRESEIALRAYKSLYDPAVLRQAAKLPKGWLRTDGCLRFNAGGFRIVLNTKDPVLVPSGNSGYCNDLGSLTGDISKEVQDFATEKEQAKKDEQVAAEKLKALLYSITSLKRLKELWPEGKKFYAYLDEAAVIGGLPAIRFDDVNVLLGLPKKKETAGAA